MNFQVPQFIETEDRIIGPLTLRQFLYLATGGGICFLLYPMLQFWLWVIIAFFVAIIFLSLAFLKINERPLPTILLAAMAFYWKPRFYLWQKESTTPKTAEIKIPESKKDGLKSHLDNLWEQLKTSKTPLPKREKNFQPSILDRIKSTKERFEMMRRITGDREMARRIDYR